MPDRKAERVKSSGLVLAICAGLAGLIWFVFGETRHYPFVNFDDPEYVYEVPEINHGLTIHGLKWAFSHLPSPNWYPLVNISHMIEAEFFGMNAGPYHLTNVCLHAVTAILLFLVLRSAAGQPWASAFVAALFAIHPLRVESVVWIIERKDVLSGVFFVLTLGAYVRYVRKATVSRYALMSILFGCGLMSKPMLVTLPLVLLLFDYWPLRRKLHEKEGWIKLILEKVPLLALSLGSALITVWGGSRFRVAANDVDFVGRLTNAIVGYVIYIWQMIWPAKLAVFYPHPGNQLPVWQVLLAAVILLAITALAWRLRNEKPYLLVGWLWYVVMMLPVMGLVQVNLQAHADRYTYLPQIGLYIAITWMVADLSLGWFARRQMLTATAAILIFSLAWVARGQARTWRDSETLWRHAIAVTQGNYLAHASLADLLLRRGNIDEAMEHCRQALRIHPADADAENNLGLALLQKGEAREAIGHFNRCLEINPDHMNGQANLAWILATSPDDATRDGARAVALSESLMRRAGHANAIVLRTLAAAYAETGRFSDATDAAQQALELAKAMGNMGLATDLEANIASYQMKRPIRSGP